MDRVSAFSLVAAVVVAGATAAYSLNRFRQGANASGGISEKEKQKNIIEEIKVECHPYLRLMFMKIRDKKDLSPEAKERIKSKV